MQSALVVLGHPNPQSFSHALGEAYAAGLTRAGLEVRFLRLCDLVFDPVLHAGFGREQPLEPDLQAARVQIETASLVAWFFPTWWAGPPALVKGFIERTFLPGWAFRYGPPEGAQTPRYRAGSSLPVPLLSGRDARVVTSMDSPGWWYRLWHRRALHAEERRRRALTELEVLGFREATRLRGRPQRSLPPKPKELVAVSPPIAR